MTGIELIAVERVRQVATENWSPEHDDEHQHGELARAAACYALPATMQGAGVADLEAIWPFDPIDFKPTSDRVRELVKAGALIAAEIDRLQRVTS